jgi:hypothetical protein
MANTIDVLDGSFEAQCERISRLVQDGRITKDLGSVLLSYYALGRYEASGESCDAAGYAKSTFNHDHEKTMLKFRTGFPADLLTT